VIIERLEDGKVVEKLEAPALWELMYFGKAGVMPPKSAVTNRVTKQLY
jgi:hypothetical protein